MPDHGADPSADGHRIAATPQPSARPDEPRLAFRSALARYKGSRLAAIRLAQGLMPSADRIRPAGTAEEITEHLDQPAAVEALAARLPIGSRLALSLFAVTEATAMPAAGLAHALGILGADAGRVDRPAARAGPAGDRAQRRARPGRRLRRGDGAHGAGAGCRSASIRRSRARSARSGPRAGRRRPTGPIGQVRESDGLEPILRLGALWQRAGAEPIRQTQQGTLYKRDRERVEEDPVLAGADRRRDGPAARPGRALAGAGAVASGWSSGTPPASGSWPPRPTSGPITRSTCRR